MNMCELIVKKKRGGRLNEKEIDWIVQGYTAGEDPGLSDVCHVDGDLLYRNG